MATNLLRLVYKSRSTLHPDEVGELDRIFRTSIRNNLHSNVSGCLACPDGRFVQVLEGPAVEVDRLMLRLTSDPRHTDIVVLGRYAAPARIFSTWAMARPDIRPLADQSLRLIIDHGSGSEVTALLLDLVQNDRSLYRLF